MLWEVELSFGDFRKQVIISDIICVERVLTTQQEIYQNANTPNITFFPIGALGQNLRSHVNRSPTECSQVISIIDQPCEPEISDFDDRIWVRGFKQQVLRFQIPVNNPLAVAVPLGVQQGSYGRSRIVFGKFPIFGFGNPFVQFATVHHLHNHVYIFVVLV